MALPGSDSVPTETQVSDKAISDDFAALSDEGTETKPTPPAKEAGSLSDLQPIDGGEGKGQEVEEEVEQEVETDKPEVDKPEIEEEETPEVQTLPIQKRIKEINQKYPQLFKEFPELRGEVFRAAKFGEIFPTIEDAQEAAEKVQIFDDLEAQVFQGQSEGLLRNLHQTDPRALQSFTENFLPTLYKINRDAYVAITTPVIKNLLRQVRLEGERTKNNNLSEASRWIASQLFGTPDLPADPKPDPRIEQERLKLEQERQNFTNVRRESFDSSVKTKLNTELRKEFFDGFPKHVLKQMGKELREAVYDKAVKDLGRQLVKDQAHIRTMQSYWQKAEKAGYAGEWEPRITTAYLGRAKNLLSSIRQKLVAELNFGEPAGEEKAEEQGETPNPPQRRRLAPSGGGVNRGDKFPTNPNQIDWKKTSTLDALNGKVALRK